MRDCYRSAQMPWGNSEELGNGIGGELEYDDTLEYDMTQLRGGIEQTPHVSTSFDSRSSVGENWLIHFFTPVWYQGTEYPKYLGEGTYPVRILGATVTSWIIQDRFPEIVTWTLELLDDARTGRTLTVWQHPHETHYVWLAPYQDLTNLG